MNNKPGQLNIGNAHIFWRNFSGERNKFDPKSHQRNFHVWIDDLDRVEALKEDGWNIKERPADDEGNVRYCMKVNVSYDHQPPAIYRVTKVTDEEGNAKIKKALLDEDTVSQLDFDDIEYIDLVISPYCWGVGKKSGISAYVKRMYVTVETDPFESKYEDDNE